MPTTLSGEIASSPRFTMRDGVVHASLLLAGDDGRRYALLYSGHSMRLTRRMAPGARIRVAGSRREPSPGTDLSAELHPTDTTFADPLAPAPMAAERPMWALYWGLEDLGRTVSPEAGRHLEELKHRIAGGFVGVDSLSATLLAQILSACAQALTPALGLEGRTDWGDSP